MVGVGGEKKSVAFLENEKIEVSKLKKNFFVRVQTFFFQKVPKFLESLHVTHNSGASGNCSRCVG
jgi:hypothetical protein